MGRTWRYFATFTFSADISTHSPRVGRTKFGDYIYNISDISTHSPRVGRTINVLINSRVRTYFNSLAPCGANRARHVVNVIARDISTHSPRVGRTNGRWYIYRRPIYFNSLAPCGANRLEALKPVADDFISTHSPRVGRTSLPITPTSSMIPFQLTRPVWGEP